MKYMRTVGLLGPFLAALLGIPTTAHAKFVEFVELKDGVHRHINVWPNIRTAFVFPERVMYFEMGNLEEYDKHITPDWRWISVQPIPRASRTNINFGVPSARGTLTLTADPSHEPVHMVIFTLPKYSGFDALPECTAPLPPPPAESTGSDLDQVLLTATGEGETVLPPISARFESGAHIVALQTGPIIVSKTRLSFRYDLTNDGDYPYPLTGLALFDRRRQGQRLRRLLPAQLPSELKAGKTLSGVIVANNPEILRKGFILELLTKPGVVPATLEWGMAPKPSIPPRNLHKLAIGAQALFGAMRLDNSAGETQWTTLTGAGARASYNALKWLSIEGAVGYIATGHADFDTGRERLTGGRVQANALIHFGEKIVPYLRAGAGVVAGSQSGDDGDSVFRFEGVSRGGQSDRARGGQSDPVIMTNRVRAPSANGVARSGRPK